MLIIPLYFEWDESKDLENQLKHRVSFADAQAAFLDPGRLIIEDLEHSQHESRFYCIGKDESNNVLTVRFTHREQYIRIFGAGYWRRGKRLYEEKNKIYQ